MITITIVLQNQYLIFLFSFWPLQTISISSVSSLTLHISSIYPTSFEHSRLKLSLLKFQSVWSSEGIKKSYVITSSAKIMKFLCCNKIEVFYVKVKENWIFFHYLMSLREDEKIVCLKEEIPSCNRYIFLFFREKNERCDSGNR